MSPDTVPTHDLKPTEAEQLSVERESRRAIAAESPLNPMSLCGSWALYYSGQPERTEQVLIVAEPQPGVYLLERFDLITDEPRGQRLMKLDDLTKVDDEGGRWTFYDDHAAVRAGLVGVMA